MARGVLEWVLEESVACTPIWGYHTMLNIDSLSVLWGYQPSLYISPTITIKSSHAILFNHHRTQIEPQRVIGTGPRKDSRTGPRKGENRAQLDDSQRRSLPSRFRLQTLYRQIFRTLDPIPHGLSPSFCIGPCAITSPTSADWGRCGEGKVYDLKRVEIWECVARVD